MSSSTPPRTCRETSSCSTQQSSTTITGNLTTTTTSPINHDGCAHSAGTRAAERLAQVRKSLSPQDEMVEVASQIPLLPAIWCVLHLHTCSINETATERTCRIVYSCVFPGLFACSSVYHASQLLPEFPFISTIRYLCHWSDRSMIFIFVAGSFQPYLTLRISSASFSCFLVYTLWMLTAIATFQQLVALNKNIVVDMILYIGIIGGYGALTTIFIEENTGWPTAMIGLAVIAAGMVFFFSDGTIPFAHAIWHLHVVAGAFTQFLSLYAYTFCRTESGELERQAQMLNHSAPQLLLQDIHEL